MAEHSKRPVLTFGSDHDLRFPLVLQFYVRETMPGAPVKYYPINSWPREGPEWVVWQNESFEGAVPPVTQFADSAGNRYELLRTFPTAPLSGLHWFVFHNQGKLNVNNAIRCRPTKSYTASGAGAR